MRRVARGHAGGVALLVAGILVVSAAAQQPTFRARADLVQVDVVVVDKDGKPVKGLKASDFGLFDRGKLQTIAAFEEFTRARAHDPPAMPLVLAARLDVANNQTASAGRLVVMVIDDLHIYTKRAEKAREIARNVLAELGPQTSMAVLFTSGHHSTQVTTDTAALAAAIDTLEGRQSWRRPHQAIDRQAGARISPENPEASLAEVQRVGDASLQDFFENMQQYKTLQQAAKTLGANNERRKAFVLISEGIGKDLSGLFGAMASAGDVPQGGTAYAAGNPGALTSIDPAKYHDLALIDMMESMRRSNVATYSIDPRGRVESKDLSLECFPAPPRSGTDPCVDDSGGLNAWASPVRQAQHGLEIMSEASGGFAVTNTDDFTSGLNRIVEDLDHSYLIGFYPSDAKGKGYRRLEVRVDGHPGWTLRYRHGYMPGGKPDPPKGDALVNLSAGILPASDLPLRLNAVALPGPGGLARVMLSIEVSAPLRDMQDKDGKVRDTLQYEVLLVDEKKAKVRSVGGLQGRVTLSPVKPGEPPPDTVAYQVSHALDVKPGRFEFRVSAVSSKLSKGGSVYLDVDVPDFEAAPIVIGGMTVGYADGVHVPVAPTLVAGGGRTGTGTTKPSTDAPLPFPPSLDRAFTASDTLRIYAEAASRVRGLIASLDVVNAAGKVVASESPSFTSGSPVRVAAIVPLRNLTPGAFLLRLTLSGAGQKATRETGFVVR